MAAVSGLPFGRNGNIGLGDVFCMRGHSRILMVFCLPARKDRDKIPAIKFCFFASAMLCVEVFVFVVNAIFMPSRHAPRTAVLQGL